MEVPCKLDPESNDEIDDKDDIEELDETSVVEDSLSETPSRAESVSNPVVLESPKSAVAVSPVPRDPLLLFVSVLLAEFVVSSEENVGIEIDGIEGVDISGMETDGMDICENTAVEKCRKITKKLKVRKAFIHYFQTGSQLRYSFFKSGLFFFKPGLHIYFLRLFHHH